MSTFYNDTWEIVDVAIVALIAAASIAIGVAIF